MNVIDGGSTTFVGLLRAPGGGFGMPTGWDRAIEFASQRGGRPTAVHASDGLLLARAPDQSTDLPWGNEGLVAIEGRIRLATSEVNDSREFDGERSDPWSRRLAAAWGGFAIAAVDESCRELLLAVDRFGQKPLYYSQCPAGFAFSPSLRAVAALSGNQLIDREALVDVFNYRALGSRGTIVSGISRLEPGTSIRMTMPGNAARTQWNVLRFDQIHGEQSITQWELACLDALERSVEVCCANRHHVSVFLSGGVDSSIIAALAARSGTPATALSLEIEDFANPELERARTVAKEIGIRHETVRVTNAEVRENYRVLAGLFDQPPRQINNLGLVALYRRAAELGGPVLSGACADSLFGAIEPSEVIALNRRSWPRRVLGVRLSEIIAVAMERMPFSHRKIGRAIEALRMDVESRCLMFERLEFGSLSGSLVNSITGGRFLSADTEEWLWRDDAGDGLTSRMRRFYFHMLCGASFARDDCIGSHFGVNTLYPFLEPEVLELALGFPDELHRSGSEKKPVLRGVCARLVSSEVGGWPKMGFPSPRDSWLTGPLAAEMGALNEVHPVLDSVLSADIRRRLDPLSDYELVWTLMNLAAIADSMSLKSA